MTTIDSLAGLSDEQLLARVHTLADAERRATVALIAALAELDARRLYLREGFSSLFTYCTQRLHLSEHAAYGRIEAARAAQRFPILLEQLADGALTLTNLCLLAPHLTSDNHQEVLAAARHKAKREVEVLLAALRPQPPVPATVRKLPTARPALGAPTRSDESSVVARQDEGVQASAAPVRDAPKPSATIAPLAPERYKLQVTLSAETYEKLRRAQDLLRHSVPNGDLAVIVDRALTLLVQELERTKFAETPRPRKATVQQGRSRHIPADVRRRVWRRDGGRCAFVGAEGRRCTERGFLEFHHVVPYADGGENLVENLELRCRAHNAYEAARWDGTLFAREPRPAQWDSVQDREHHLWPLGCSIPLQSESYAGRARTGGLAVTAARTLSGRAEPAIVINDNPTDVAALLGTVNPHRQSHRFHHVHDAPHTEQQGSDPRRPPRFVRRGFRAFAFRRFQDPVAPNAKAMSPGRGQVIRAQGLDCRKNGIIADVRIHVA